MANQCIFPPSPYSFALDEKTDSQGNGKPDGLFSSSIDSSSSSLSSYTSNHYNESCGNHDYSSASQSYNTSSFLQRIKFNSRYNRPSSLLELRYGQFQSGIIGKGAYAMVRLVKSKTNHHHHHHSNSVKRIHADSDSTPTATTYAVKIFKKVKRTENHGKYMKRLISEYCIASSMHHPNIIKTLDLVTDVSNRYCIVMEYCSGGDLYRAIKKNKVTSAKTKSYFKQLLLGLDYLHSLGVAHRDVKPENLLLSGDGNILKLTDFGVADVFCETWQRHSRLSDGFCGSLAFIAPEIFAKHGDSGKSTMLSSHLSQASSSLSPSSSTSSSASSSSSLIVRSRTKGSSGYQASKVDVWSAAIVYCCMCFKGTIFTTAQSSDPYYRAYLNTYYSRSFAPFAPLENTEMGSILYQMLDPDPDRRISTSQLLSLPYLQSINPALAS